MKLIRNLRIGDCFKLKPNGKVYVCGAYERSLKKYSYFDYDDMNNEHFASGYKLVIVDLDDEDFKR